MIEVLPMMPTTWSLCTSCLASDAIWVGFVCSFWMKYLIGWPLMPPFAFTQSKYAPAMFAMSAKLVPVWSVTIEPRLIGVPVAATPGFVPHDEVWTPVAAGLLATGLLAAWLVGLLLLLLLLLLL